MIDLEFMSGQLGRINVAKRWITILLSENRSMQLSMYRISRKEHELMNTKLRKTLKSKIVEPSETDWASLTVPFPKRDSSLCFSADFRRLNVIIAK